MGLYDEKTKSLGLFDIKLLQWAAVFVGLVVVKLLQPVLNIYSVNIWWFAGIAALLSIKPVYVILSNWQNPRSK